MATHRHARLLAAILLAVTSALPPTRSAADGHPPPAAAATARDPAATVTATERAFARSMADRDFAAFSTFIAADATFLNGGSPLRGRAAILAYWERFFSGPDAPFSWEPDLVEVLSSGDLAMSVGPVRGPDGATIARFYSVWRRSPEGSWSIVFDNGYSLCDCGKAGR